MVNTKIKYVLLVISFAFVTLLTNIQAASAQGQDAVIQLLLKRAESSYNKGDFIQANHEFSKVLLMDPNNEVALYFLNQIGVNDALYARPKMSLFHVAQLTEDLDRYQQRVLALEKERAHTMKFNRALQLHKRELRLALNSKREVITQLSYKFKEYQKEAKSQLAKDKATIKEITKSSEIKDEKIAYLHAKLNLQEEKTAEKLALIREKDRQLKRLDKQLTDSEERQERTARTWETRRKDYEKQLVILGLELKVLKEEEDTLRQSIGAKAKENKQLQLEMSRVQKEARARTLKDKKLIVDMKMAGLEKNGEISQLKKKMYELNDRITQDKTLIAEKEEELQKLNKQVSSSEQDLKKERLAFDARIRFLKEELVSLKTEEDFLRQDILVKKKENTGLSQKLKQLEGQVESQEIKTKGILNDLEESIAHKTMEIDSLKTALEDLRHKENMRLAQIKEKNQKVDEMKKQIEHLNQRLAINKELMQGNMGTYADQIQLLRQDLALAKKEEDALRQELFLKTEENEGLNQEIKEVEKVAGARTSTNNRTIAELEAAIKAMENNESKKMALIKKQDQQIEELSKNLKSAEREWKIAKMAYETRIEDFNAKYYSVDKVNELKDKKISRLEELVRKHRIQLSYMSDKMKINDFKRAHKNSEVVEYEKKFRQLKHAYNSVNQQLALIQSRMGEGASLLPQAETPDMMTQNDTSIIKMIKRQDRILAELKQKLTLAGQRIKEMDKQMKTQIADDGSAGIDPVVANFREKNRKGVLPQEDIRIIRVDRGFDDNEIKPLYKRFNFIGKDPLNKRN